MAPHPSPAHEAAGDEKLLVLNWGWHGSLG